MLTTEKIGDAMRRSLPHVPADARAVVSSLLKPQSLALIAGTLVVWAGSRIWRISLSAAKWLRNGLRTRG
jgi:hypothetical protein